MIDANGKNHPNYSCRSCRHRHPPGWTCAHAAEIAQLGRPRVSPLPRAPVGDPPAEPTDSMIEAGFAAMPGYEPERDDVRRVWEAMHRAWRVDLTSL